MAPRRIGFWCRLTAGLVRPVLKVVTQANWSGMQLIPATGGVIFAANHLSEFDPLVVSDFIYASGRWPQFLAKSSLFKVPVLGPLLSAVKQIPVDRGTVDAAKALDAAIAAVKGGAGLVIYPEGTTPKKGDLWPRRGKTGVARLFLATGAPVVPIASWGAQQIFDPRVRKLHLGVNIPVTVVAGEPIDLSKWVGAEPTAANLYAITEEIMGALRQMLGEITGETPPEAPTSGARGNGSARKAAAAASTAAPAASSSSSPSESTRSSSESASSAIAGDADSAAGVTR